MKMNATVRYIECHSYKTPKRIIIPIRRENSCLESISNGQRNGKSQHQEVDIERQKLRGEGGFDFRQTWYKRLAFITKKVKT